MPPSMAQPGTDQEAEEDDSLKGDVGGEKVGDLGADPDAEGERDKEEGHQGDGLAGAAMVGEEQVLEGTRPGESAGHRRGYAKLDEQRDDDEGIGHSIRVTQEDSG